MDLTTDKLPNKMLNGEEVLEIAVDEFRQMLKRDCMFIRTIAYRRVAFTLQGIFHFGYPHPTDHVVKSRTKVDGPLEGEIPLIPDPPDGESEVTALERDVNLDNPNIARVQHDLPIVTQETRPPAPIQPSVLDGDAPTPPNPYPEVVTHKLKYDKTQFETGPAPVDRDVSDAKAKELGIKRRGK